MSKSHRERVLNVLSRQTRIRLETDMQRLRTAIGDHKESSFQLERAETRAAAALNEIHRQSSPGQPLNLEVLKNGVSYRHDCVNAMVAARQRLDASEAVVNDRRDDVTRHRLRLEKLDERQKNEEQRLAGFVESQQQKEVDETWVLAHSSGSKP